MNTGNAKQSRIFYLILVPIILVVILLNSGFLQARIPAVTVGGSRFNVAQFNYYYFTELNSYIEDNFDEDGLNGPFDQSASLKTQYREDGSSWWEYFCTLAENDMKKVVYYSNLAETAGYEFSEEELAPIQTQMDAIEEDRLLNSISLSNYLVAYWGVGMTEAIYTGELTRQVKAEAYQTYLMETASVSNEDIESWIEENAPDSYASANLRIIVLDAAEDRFTGEVEEQQLTDLAEKLARLVERYEADPSAFAELAVSFCDDADLAEAEGIALNCTRSDLPDLVAEWVFTGEHQEGDYTSLVDESTEKGYLVIFDGWGEDVSWLTAVKALRQEQVTDAETAATNAYTISYHTLGKRLIGG
ncbi:MAG: hypothetical protein LUD79_00675 [Oscillospiraceae bacterium]|nr:hypothetical protein [Oscillospiraceae bacterium]